MTERIVVLQDQVEEWTDHNFPRDTRSDVALGTMEEIGEIVEAVLLLVESGARLSRAVLKQQQGIRGTYDEWNEEIRKETADVFIKLCHMASKCNFSLLEAIDQRWEVVRRRDFVADPVGHGLPK